LLVTEEGLAHRVCLLLIELHLSTQQPDQALSLIAYIENQFVSTENATKMIGDKDLKTLEKEHQEKAVSFVCRNFKSQIPPCQNIKAT
jgi:hypothetical protein